MDKRPSPALLPLAAALLLASGTAKSADVPAGVSPATAQPATPAATDKDVPEEVEVSRTDRNEVVSTADQRLALTKLERQEQALVRQAVVVTTAVRLTRPTAQIGDMPAPDMCRWTYQSFLQRQVCFTSMTGLFACTEPAVTDLPDKTEGSAPLTADQSAAGACGEAFPAASAAKTGLVGALRARSDALFDADRRAKVDPVFKAAGAKATPVRP